jgi:UDP-N-acetylmuramoyl-tripeptide--D-alanyl-D-alanine ligase
MLTVADVIQAQTGRRLPAAEAIVLTGAVHDSRDASAGALFVALPGEHVDGHDYVAAAFEGGCAAALVQRPIEGFINLDLRGGLPADATFEAPLCLVVEDSLQALQQAARFWRSQLDLRVVGITGSVGKTTSKELIADVLGQQFETFKSLGNFNNEIGLPLSVLGITEEHAYAVLEMGFYVIGEIAFLVDIAQPQIGLVTNIGTVHAERAGSQDAIFKGKSELVAGLPQNGVAILNFDDPRVKAMAEFSPARVFTYGLDPAADLWADHIEGLGLDGLRFTLHHEDQRHTVEMPMIGRHSVYTALGAAAVGLVEGMGWETILAGLRAGRSELRLVTARSANGALLLDDTYNASPESTLAALELLSDLDGRKVAVLGDMLELGQYERQGHEAVGRLAAEVADVLVTVGQRARTIAETARAGGLDAVIECDSSDEALDYLQANLGATDVVLVKGSRAMYMENIVPGLEVAQ